MLHSARRAAGTATVFIAETAFADLCTGLNFVLCYNPLHPIRSTRHWAKITINARRD